MKIFVLSLKPSQVTAVMSVTPKTRGGRKELLAAGYWLLAFGYWLLASICGFGEREAEDGKLRVWSRQLKAGSQQLF